VDAAGQWVSGYPVHTYRTHIAHCRRLALPPQTAASIARAKMDMAYILRITIIIAC
jgi:hypothetical protein